MGGSLDLTTKMSDTNKQPSPANAENTANTECSLHRLVRPEELPSAPKNMPDRYTCPDDPRLWCNRGYSPPADHPRNEYGQPLPVSDEKSGCSNESPNE